MQLGKRMKSPLWIVTSIIGTLLVALLLFMLISMGSLFERPPMAPLKERAVIPVDIKEEAAPTDLSVIYEDQDLFGTFRPALKPVTPVETLPTIPTPPRPIPPQQQRPPHVQFLPPLPLKITGIIAATNEQQSQVSFLNTSSLLTESLRIGDKILDAYILRIFPRKVIVIRSNGQEEIIYMYPAEAQTATTQMQDTSWAEVVQRQHDNFLINPIAFGSRIQSLAEFIEMLDLTTASKQGKPLGLRVGNMSQTSIGKALGLLPGDIVIKILNDEPTSTKLRLKIFNEITSLSLGDKISVEILRKNRTLTYTYTLFNLADPSVSIEDVQPMASVVPERSGTRQSTQRPPQQTNRARELDAMRMFGGRPDKGLL